MNRSKQGRYERSTRLRSMREKPCGNDEQELPQWTQTAHRQLEIAGTDAPSRILHRVVERNVGHLLIFLIDPQVPFLVMLSSMASGVSRTLAIPSTKISLAK